MTTTKIPCLNDGFVQLIDHMGSDSSICNAARVSYGNHETKENKELKAWKQVCPNIHKDAVKVYADWKNYGLYVTLENREEVVYGPSDSMKLLQDFQCAYTRLSNEYKDRDRNLIRYLMRHRHCYHPHMQVLTTDGWKRWELLSGDVEFLVPDPKSGKLRRELLAVKTFDCDEVLYCYKNKRMSYRVTSEHTMWFRSKHEKYFRKIEVQNMSKWGHFDCGANYEYLEPKGKQSEEGKLIGFFLGDGSFSSPNTISFHLKKNRKKEYLLKILAKLKIEPTISEGWNGALKYSIPTPDFIHNYCEGVNSKEKRLKKKVSTIDTTMLKGIFWGLVYSDGCKRKDRVGQINFSSSSPYLIELFQTLGSMHGFDVHRVRGGKEAVTAYLPGRTTLESRSQYHYREHYKGKVYCATSSTGLLLVRGESNEFSFVCGNTTPFEMVSFVFLVRAPIHVARQWFRHRTWSYNEYSTRYKEAIDSFETTDPDKWRKQATNNKQGSGEYITGTARNGMKMTQGEFLSIRERDLHEIIADHYQEALDIGVAREQARKDLPLSTYTEFYAKVDLHNLFHFLSLRCDKHAQLEIRTYANAIAEIIKPIVPISYQAFEDYRLNGCSFSSQEMEMLRHLIQEGEMRGLEKPDSLSTREWNEFKEKLQ